MRLTLTELQNEGKAALRPSESAQNVAWRSPVCFLASEEEGEAGRLPRASCFSPSTHQSDVPPSPVWGMEALLRGALLMDGLTGQDGGGAPVPTACFDSWIDRTHVFVKSQTQHMELSGTLLLLLRLSLSQTRFFISANATETA